MRTVLVAAPAPVAAALVLALAARAAHADIADKLDQQAPEIECAKWFAGQPTQIAKLRGRVVVLHLSDPERITSQAAVATLRKLAAAWKDHPVTIVEVVTAPMEATGATYAAKELPPWTVGWDAKGATSLRYAGSSVPRTYLIGPDGRVVFHAHVQAFTKDLVQGQVDRVPFFDVPADVKKARNVAKLASEQRYGAALAEAAKVEADKFATDADRALCKLIQADVERTWALQSKVLDALIKENDWGLAWRRADRMRTIFQGTTHQAAADKVMAELEAKEIVPYVKAVQDTYDKLLEDVAKARTRKQFEEVVDKVRRFAGEHAEHNRPGARAKTLLEQLEKRLAEWEGR